MFNMRKFILLILFMLSIGCFAQTGLVGEISYQQSTSGSTAIRDIGYLTDSVDFDTLRFRLDKFEKYYITLALDTTNAGMPSGVSHKVAVKWRTVSHFYYLRNDHYVPPYDVNGTLVPYTTVEDSVKKVGLELWNNFDNVSFLQDSCLDMMEVVISRVDSIKGGMGATSSIKYILRLMGQGKLE
jgi:hypothetical protein